MEMADADILRSFSLVMRWPGFRLSFSQCATWGIKKYYWRRFVCTHFGFFLAITITPQYSSIIQGWKKGPFEP